MATPVEREKLKTDLALSRDALGAYIGALRQDLDFGAKLKRSTRNNRWAWYAAAGVLGLLLSKLPPFRRKVVVKGPKLRKNTPQEVGKAGFLLAALKFGLDFAKPALLRGFKDRFLAARRQPATPPFK